MNIAIILAAGSSNRFNGKKPKQFEYFNKKMILEYSVDTFINHPEIDEVIIVVKKSYLNEIEKSIKGCKIIQGGKKRQDSSLLGLMACPTNTRNVLIHDAARPFVSNTIISNCIVELKNSVAVCPAIPVNDTVAIINSENNISSMLDRNFVYCLQTPQAFHYKIIFECHKELEKNVTDDISVLQEFNYNCKLIKGSQQNLKVTYQDDLNKLSNFKI
ncbi:MAG: 2-C-methyl-D-erythritol 4-phosphate cytidylyltransferase [Candidatus Marinimicrobia bacterium]|nr:2-C-methyl-D-erythritol 4-phosphate cytidylyltransferase [Candidatus Neomarinimicrobiota bacterium]|tara:strand:- start:1028 stop:1675 length:648 start_codon:yes stop_codon:yes gene_type:complete